MPEKWRFHRWFENLMKKTTDRQIGQVGRSFLTKLATPVLREVGGDRVQKLLTDPGDQAKLNASLGPVIEKALRDHFAAEPVPVEPVIAHAWSGEKKLADLGWNHSSKGIPDVEVQMQRQHKAFGFGRSHKAVLIRTFEPDARAEGYIVVPVLRDVSAAWNLNGPALERSTYCSLVAKMATAIKKARRGKVINYLESALSEERLQVNAEARTAIESLEGSIPFEQGTVHYMAIPIHTGYLFSETEGLMVYSPRYARVTALQMGALPLGLAHVLAFLIGWPQRLYRYGVRWIDCIADEFRYAVATEFRFCPCVSFSVGDLRVNANLASDARSYYGSPLAFPGVRRPK